MDLPVSIFLDFNLPNATTWFYFSFLLAVALFFKFSRLLSIRNLDVITIFVLVPGLLLLQQSRNRTVVAEDAANVASLVGKSSAGLMASPQAGITSMAELAGPEVTPAYKGSSFWIGYLWLLIGSVYFFLRCLLDLVLVRRPALTPNLNSGGMAWLAGAMFICLAAVALRPPQERTLAPAPPIQATLPASATETVGQPSAMVKLAQSQFDSSYLLARSFAILCHLSVVIGLLLIGWLHFQDISSGMAAATFYLLLPYTGYFVGQVHHVWPMALMIWAIVLYRQPTFSALFLGLAAGTVFFPVFLAPLWISFYWRRGSGRFTTVFFLSAGICLAITALILWLNHELFRIISDTFALSDWQPWNWKEPTHEGFWTGVHWAYRTPIFILYLALVAVTAFWPHPKTLAHLLALSAALLIGIQLWYADQGGVYVLWYLPLLLLIIFRPNLTDRRPKQILLESDWLTRLLGKIKNFIHWLFKSPGTLVRVR